MASSLMVDLSCSGRPKASPVWDYFENENNESVCLVKTNLETDNEKTCGMKVKGKNPTNLKQHLSRYHKEEFENVTKKEEEARSKKSKSISSVLNKRKGGQISINEMLKPKKFAPDSEKYKRITRKMAIFIGSAPVSHSLVENDEFRELIGELEPRYVLPGRGGIRSDLFRLVSKLKTCIGKLISEARQIHFCCDIWSKKGMQEAFLGIVAHFHANGERHKVTLAVRNIYGSHTASNVLSIVKDVLEEWHIRKLSWKDGNR